MKWYIMMIVLTFILNSCQTDSSGTHPSGNQLDKSLEEYKKKLERSIHKVDELEIPSSIFPEPTVSFGSPSRFKGIIFIAEDGYYQGKMGQLAFSTKLDAIKESLMKYRNEKQIEGTIWVKIEIDKNSSKSDLIDLLVMFKSIEVSPISI